MQSTSVKAGLAALTLAAAMAVCVPAGAQGYYGGRYYGGMMGPGMMGSGMMMGPGMMYGPMMGPWMMMGPGMPGCPYAQQQANLDLSAADVKARLENWMAMMGNPHLKLGTVTEQDANTIVATIVTTDKGGLVQKFSIDRKTGQWKTVE